MRDIIRRHNRLNGVTFCIIEFGCIALLIGAFGIYYLLHQRIGPAIVALGITLNCVTVVVIALRQLAQDKASGRHSGSFWNKTVREQLRRENPNMLRDTMILTVSTLLPFATLAAVAIDISRPPDA